MLGFTAFCANLQHLYIINITNPLLEFLKKTYTTGIYAILQANHVNRFHFLNNKTQAVRLPKGAKFADDIKVDVRKIGNDRNYFAN